MELKEAIEIAVYVRDLLKDTEASHAIEILIDHAKKSIEPLEGEALVGDALVGRRVKYVSCDYKVIKYSSLNNDYLLEMGNCIAWFKRENFEVIE